MEDKFLSISQLHTMLARFMEKEIEGRGEGWEGEELESIIDWDRLDISDETVMLVWEAVDEIIDSSNDGNGRTTVASSSGESTKGKMAPPVASRLLPLSEIKDAMKTKEGEDEISYSTIRLIRAYITPLIIAEKRRENNADGDGVAHEEQPPPYPTAAEPKVGSTASGGSGERNANLFDEIADEDLQELCDFEDNGKEHAEPGNSRGGGGNGGDDSMTSNCDQTTVDAKSSSAAAKTETLPSEKSTPPPPMNQDPTLPEEGGNEEKVDAQQGLKNDCDNKNNNSNNENGEAESDDLWSDMSE
eukprot:jgi/Bigna1/146661/aug1.119_g21369